MTKLLSFATVAFFSLVGIANASIIDVTLGATGTSLSYGTGGTLVANYNLANINPNNLDDAYIVNPATSVSGYFAQPTGPIYQNNYLAVFGSPYFTGSATIDPAHGTNTIGFTWGSIDDYNTAIITDSRGVTYDITGADILNQIAGSTVGATQSNVTFYDPYGSIVKVVLESSLNSFEVANFEASSTPSSVPLPPALPLFAMALLAIGFAAHRKTAKAI